MASGLNALYLASLATFGPELSAEERAGYHLPEGFDPVFFQNHGIVTCVEYASYTSIAPSVIRRTQATWEEYQSRFTLPPSPELLETAAAFQACINGSSPHGEDRWAKKCEVRWINEEIGFGVFAKEAYEEGEVVGFYAGVLTDEEEDNDYCFRFSDPFDGLVIDASIRGNFTRYFNHAPADRCNLSAIEYPYDGLPYIMFVAKDRILRGQQLSFDYEDAYWETKGVVPLPLI